MEVVTTDWHTAGEPFRIVLEGVPEITGATVAERRVAAMADPAVDRVRRLLCHEPRGHADMYGGFLVPPDDDGADLGVLFWHKDGFSTACGHGTIALGAWAVRSGRVACDPDGETEVVVDVPSGRVVARVRLRGGAVEAVTFRNVASSVVARGVDTGEAKVDIAFGGALYACVPAAAFGLPVTPDALPELIAAGRRVKEALHGTAVARWPADERLSGIYGTILWEHVAPRHQRNVAVFADGEVARSPCGSGTCARVALLADSGELAGDDVLRHDSVLGTTFHARVADRVQDGVVVEVEGTAFPTGEHRFTLDPADPLAEGFLLR
jgi:proline racemase